MNLAGKTIRRVEEYSDRLFFTDGTSATCGEYGLDFVDYADTQTYLHEQQGRCESARMCRLHDTLHPRDKQYLAEQERLRSERRYAAASPEHKVMLNMEAALIADMRRDMNRSVYGEWTLPLPLRRKRKRRPSKEYEIGRTYLRENGSLFHVGATLKIPYLKSGS